MTWCKISLSFGSIHFKHQFLIVSVILRYRSKWKHEGRSIGQFPIHLAHEVAEKSIPSLLIMAKSISKVGKKNDIAILLTPFFPFFPLKINKNMLISRHMLIPRLYQSFFIICERSKSDISKEKGGRKVVPYCDNATYPFHRFQRVFISSSLNTLSVLVWSA